MFQWVLKQAKKIHQTLSNLPLPSLTPVQKMTTLLMSTQKTILTQCTYTQGPQNSIVEANQHLHQEEVLHLETLNVTLETQEINLMLLSITLILLRLPPKNTKMLILR